MRISVLGIELDPIPLEDLCMFISSSVSAEKKRIIAHHNLHSLYLFHHDSQMRDFYGVADLIHIDGMSLVYLARLLGHRLQRKHRVTYLDFIWPLMEECARQKWRVFHLGGKPGVAEIAAQRLRGRVPELQIKTVHGYFGKTSKESVQILELINDYKPNVLLVGLGMPLQEHWIMENLEKIDANTILCAGACFDYIAGTVPSPPRWVGQLGFEWLFRLVSEPKRLWRRYLLEPWFVVGLILKEQFR